MNLYSKKQLLKITLLLIGLLIAIISLFYTNTLVKKLAQEERKNVELWAKGMQKLGEIDNNSDLSIILQVVKNNKTVPLIIVDKNDNILYHKNLDSTQVSDSLYLKKQLEEMKIKNPPIINKLTETEKQYIYYKDSILLTQLLYYPYIQLSIILIFILIAYYAFDSSRKSEQNQVWVGMSKETAHQLGTPISSLMAWLEILKEKSENQKLLTEIENDIHRLEIIADRFSKIGSKPQLDKININQLLSESINYIRARISSQIKIESEFDTQNSIFVFINAPLFSWVIENLLKNAADAMKGEGKIVFQITDVQQFLYIDISDTGKGIAKKNYKTIFDPGFTTKRRGWGLGLSLAKRIVEDYHKGKIFIKKSEINKGTTFRIVIKK
jgi:K+-sensing histidine kinase KdpD